MLDILQLSDAAKRLRATLKGHSYTDPALLLSDLAVVLDQNEELLEDLEFFRESDRIWQETEKKTPEEISADLAAAGITETDLIEQRRNFAMKISPELEKDFLSLQRENERLRAQLNRP